MQTNDVIGPGDDGTDEPIPDEIALADRGDRPASLAQVEGSIATRLEIARKDLLDLGLRNSLLNHRLLRARGVEVVDELSAVVFRILVLQGKKMSFLPTREDGEGALLAQPGEDSSATEARRTDLRLQTAVSSTQLQSRLLATYYAARTSIEEQGVNTLFLALGMLHWYDSRDSSQVRKAPLVLVPVELERTNAGDRFRLRYTGEEIGPNLSLMEKLRVEYHITLPPMPEVEDLDVDSYLDQVGTAVQSQVSWSIQPSEIALGFFSFAKLLMFKDLDTTIWAEDEKPTDHVILQSLLGDGFHEAPSTYSDDENLDAKQEPGELHPVLDADSSQTLAILDVTSGKNLVIQGPPGTGKSQTITNLIGECIASGKTVLFVAEKLAALDVVKRRLDKVGLGDACLELHSHKTSKKALLGELRRTLELGRPRDVEPAGDRARLRENRDRLNAYCEAVNTPIGSTGVTPYEAQGEVVRLKQRYGDGSLLKLHIPEMINWDVAAFRRYESLVVELGGWLTAWGVPAEHPFWGSGRTTFLPTQEDELRNVLRSALRSVDAIQEAGATLADALGVDAPKQRSAIQQLLPSSWQFWRQWFGKDRTSRAQVRDALATHAECVRGVTSFLEMEEASSRGEDGAFVDRPFEEQRRSLAKWLEDVSRLHSLAEFTGITQRCRDAGLVSAISAAVTWGGAPERFSVAFRYTWFAGLLERAHGERKPLSGFSRPSHEHALQEFAKLDGLLGSYNSIALAREHWNALPRQNGNGQLGILKREFEKKTRHLPIRQLMLKAGKPIQAIKPVFMMSPLSIAQYLPPGSQTFDVVIFDEASQVRPVDAFGALLRGRQAVVVGDSRQLPPTNFFDTLIKSEEIDEENVTSDFESVLGLFSAQMAHERMLRWHYRSRHESLIAVSNHAFYHDRLVVFPSPDADREDAGLVYHHLPHSTYDRGRTRTNQVEAEIVARAVMEHAQTTPHLSLGVAAFSVAQMQAVQDQVEFLRRQDSNYESFFTDEHPHEQFFVKNLETVQGDERDVIFISIGYGRTAEGYLSMSFGPLNGDGGDRRLNVLITRARARCEVFTNLTSADIDDSGKGSGVRALKMFLEYAESGHLDIPIDTEAEADSPFEEAVCHALTIQGYLVKKQIGSAGFRIDLAVVDPERPGRYLLGIECDGATYHSARSARDRDRLRQQVLENLGWRIHRIWSTDWFRDPDREIRRVIEATETATQECARLVDLEPTGTLGRQAPIVQREIVQGASRPTESVPAYKTASLSVRTGNVELHQVDPRLLADWITTVVEVESPVHTAEVARRIVEAVGIKRVGSRIEASIDRAAHHAVRAGAIVQRGPFLWRKDMRVALVRDRSRLQPSARKIEMVAPQEIERSVVRAVTEAYGMPEEQVAPSVCRLLGFGRCSEDMKVVIEARLQELIRTNALMSRGGTVQLPAQDMHTVRTPAAQIFNRGSMRPAR